MNFSKFYSTYTVLLIITCIRIKILHFFKKLEQELPKYGQILSSPQTRKKKQKLILLYVLIHCSFIIFFH